MPRPLANRLQLRSIEPALDGGMQGLNGLEHAVRNFAVTRIWNGLAAAAVNAIVKFSDDDNGFGLAAAADGECTGQRPALDACGQFHANLFEVAC